MAGDTWNVLDDYAMMKRDEFGSDAWLDDLFQRNHIIAEMQAMEACDWLKETGFPQYAHMYRDGQMPIDLEVAERDHSFLDEISLRSLFCRLEILNKCFNLHINPSSEVKMRSRRKNEATGSHVGDGNDNDDEVEIALSHRWTYEPHSHRWSRSCEGDQVTHSSTHLHFNQSDEADEEEEPEKIVESDVESNISEVNGSGFESSSESKSFEDVTNNMEDIDQDIDEETLTRKKRRKFDSGIEFMSEIGKIFSKNDEENVAVSKPRIHRRGMSDNGGVQFENMDGYFEPDYRDIFDSLADLSKTLLGEFGVQESSFNERSRDDNDVKTGGDDDDDDAAMTSQDKQDGIPGYRQTEQPLVLLRSKKGQTMERSMRSSLSSSTPSSHSSLSMASYTLQEKTPDDKRLNQINHHHQQHLHEQEQQQHQILSATLSTRSENSYLTNRITETTRPEQNKPIIANLFNKRRDKLDDIIPDDRKSSDSRRITMYASRDSFTPSECNLATRYCFPKTLRHRHPPPPSPLLTRAADKLRGAFNFFRKIDNSGSMKRRSVRKKEKKNVENAEEDFMFRLVKSDIGSPSTSQSRVSSELKTKVESLKCFNIQDDKTTTTSCSDKSKLSNNSADNSTEMMTGGDDDDADGDDDDTLKMMKNKSRKMSTYDNVCTTQDFDRILDDLYSNIYLLDQSLVFETDEDSKSQTGSIATPSSNDSHSPFCYSTNESAKRFKKLSEQNETVTLKSTGHTGDVFKRDDADDVSDDGAGDDSDDDKKWRYPDVGERERRDSGVGSSLTRRPSNRRTVRWQSFLKDRQSSSVSIPDLSRLSAQQIAILERYCLLRITSILEKYGSISRKSWKNLMNRKQKSVCLSDYPQHAIFGVPLEVLRIRHGQALPKCVILAMKKLRRSIGDCDGIFRKAGAKIRVQALKDAIVSDPDSIDYEESSVHDLADILKSFLKELPECLFTGRFSKILTNIFKNVPKELHMESVQACLVLMPNEHRDCLHTFMLFCHYLSNHSHVTQMNASNLSLCLSPSFFHIDSNSSSSGSTNRRQQAAYKKCIDEQKYVHQCLTFIIENAPFLFTNYQSFFEKCHITPTTDLSTNGYLGLQENMDQQYNANLCSSRLRHLFQFVTKETKSNGRGWSFPHTISSSSLIPSSSSSTFQSTLSSVPDMSVEVSYKKAGDPAYPLRLWRCSVVVEAPPVEVLTRILWDRHLWDFDLLKWRRAEKIDNNTEVFQYVLNSMAPHPPRMYSELRSWKVDLKTGSCALVCQSVDYPRASSGCSVQAEVQSSHYNIEPCGSGRCRLTLISRIDFKGHNLSWYNHMYDHIVGSQLLRISLTLKNNILSSNLPETKV